MPVSVTTVGGTSPVLPGDIVEYEAVPVVEQLAPASGVTNGGTLVTVSGVGLGAALLITVGSMTITQFSEHPNGDLTFTMPPGHAGTVDVRVQTLVGLSAVGGADRFKYVPPRRAAAAPKS